jgi:hypothetical protein
MDPLMRLCWEATKQLGEPSRVCDVPAGSLQDTDAKVKLVTSVEALITAHIQSTPHPTIPTLVARLRGDTSLCTAASQCFPGMAVEDALALALKFYSGFWGVAKATRDKYAQGPGLPDADLLPEQRGKEMDAVHEIAEHDKVVDLGARFGWWGRARPDRKQRVFDEGISDAHKRHYLADYYKIVAESEATRL